MTLIIIWNQNCKILYMEQKNNRVIGKYLTLIRNTESILEMQI